MDLASLFNSVAKPFKPSQPPQTQSQPQAQDVPAQVVTPTPQVVQQDVVMMREPEPEKTATAMEIDGPVAGPSRQQPEPSSQVSTSTVRDVTVRATSLPPVLSPDRRRVGYIYDDLMLLHSSRTEHPEVPGRIRRVIEKLRDSGDLRKMRKLGIRKATKGEVLLVHSEDHWDKVDLIQRMTQQEIIDTESYYDHLSLYICPHTTYAALLSCGGVIEATLAVAKGEIPKTFAIVRPPGHHAEPEEHMGFCFFNNVAVATRVVQQRTSIKRILILDWDVHHGNGTQRAFLEDPDVLYISLHRYEGGSFYPCGPFGGLDSCGEGAGLGKSVNIPWPEKGMGDADYLYAFQNIIMPIAMEFAPELVIISAGFDAAEGDELGQCKVTPGGYAHMTQMLSTLAGGKVVVALEGGYNIESVGNSALAVARTLIGDDPPELVPLMVSEAAVETIWQVSRVQSQHWKNINPKAVEPAANVPEITVPIPDILKAFRQQWLFRECEMYEVPLLQDLQPSFESQLACSKDVLDNDTIVIFAHQFGNIRVEISNAQTFDIDLEYSYLIDVSQELLRWVRKRKFALAEVNTYPRLDMKTKIHANVTAKDYKPPKSSAQLGLEALLYLWDNYIELSSASKLILIGHGPGCQTIMDLITERKKVVMDRVKAVVQVVGTSTIPLIPKGQEQLRTWYKQHSFVAVPKIHPIFIDGTLVKRHGRVVAYDEEKPILLLSTAMTDIQQFIDSSIL